MRRATALARLAAPHLGAGRRWYREGQLAVSRLGDHAASVGAGVGADPAAYAAGVVAVTSPRTTVWGGLQQACAWISCGRRPHLPSVAVALARFEATGEILGPKTRAFALALAGEPSAVVLDVWLSRALGVPHRAMRGMLYQRAAARVREAAMVAGVTPATMQAAIWLAMRPTGHRGGHLTVDAVDRAWEGATC